MKNDAYYQTSDLCLVTVLSLTLTIEKTEKLTGNKVVFLFQNTPKLKETVDTYWKRGIRVEPQDFFNQLRVVKTMIYESR